MRSNAPKWLRNFRREAAKLDAEFSRSYKRADRRMIAAGVISCILVASAVFLFPSPRGDTHPPCYPVSMNDLQELYGASGIQIPSLNCSPLNPWTQDYRPQYKGLNITTEQIMFGNLPPYPRDLINKVYNILRISQLHTTYDWGSLASEYWMQPEFYPGWKWNDTIAGMLVPMTTYWTPQGYGAYPSTTVVNATAGTAASVDVYFYLHASWNVTHFQVFGLYAHASVPGISVTFTNADDPYYTSLKGNASFVPTDFNGNPGLTLSLTPTKWRFDAGWVIPIHARVTVGPGLEAGEYSISFGTVNPSDWVVAQYYTHYEPEYGIRVIASGGWNAGSLAEVDIGVA